MGVSLELIGFDSMGSRGMATVVYTDSIAVFIDPGVSFAPKRYGLPPHPLELERLQQHLDRIHSVVNECDVVVISHYHRDHYLYRDGEENYYQGKTLFIKHPLEDINVSQRIRAHKLLKKMGVREKAKKVVYADSTRHVLDKGLEISFSPPQPHGVDGTPLGYVVMTLLDIGGFRIMHASDVQGPIAKRVKDYIVGCRPHLLIISGPPTYFEGYRLSSRDLENAIDNLLAIMDSVDELETIILDHHLLRDLGYREKLSRVYEHARVVDKRVVTAAEYMGREVEQLEALRKELWRKDQ